MSANLMGLLVLAAFVFSVILIICWIALPFYVQGTNKRLDKIIKLMEAANRK